jgi:hypothetical protein
MRYIANIFFLPILLASCGTGRDTMPKEPNAVEAATCGASDGSGRPCHLSQITLLGSAKAYNGKIIQMVSFVALDRGRLVIYPSREFFHSGDRFSSIELIAPYEELRRLSHRFAFEYVHVRGLFEMEVGIQGSESRFGKLNNMTINAPAIPGVEDRSNLDPDIIVNNY